MNINGYESIDEVLEDGLKPLSESEFETIAEETNAVIVDTRSEVDFVKGFIPNSIFIGVDGSFATWVGTILKDVTTPIVFVADEGREEEVAVRMARIGFDNTLGYLKGRISSWRNAGKRLETIMTFDAKDLAFEFQNQRTNILDVRKESEYNSQHLEEAMNAPLDYYEDELAKLDKEKTYHVHCAGGYRSVIFISLLQSKGYTNLINVAGGFEAIQEDGTIKTTEYVCPTTLL